MKTLALALVGAVVFSFAGCGNTTVTEEPAPEATAVEETAEVSAEVSAEESATEVVEEAQDVQNDGTVVVTDARGEVEIPANPQRIVDISGNSDILSILGYKVVGTANSDAYDYTKFPAYLEDVLSGATILGYSMQATMDLESILSLEPDLIIISSVQESMYDQLQEVAPTVMIELAQIDWTDDLLEVANIFSKTSEAEQWLADYKAHAAEVGESLKASYGEDASYLSFLASGGSIFIFDAAGIGSVLYDDCGLNRPEGMPEQSDISLPVVTYEGLAAIDADYIFAVGTEEDLAALYESPLWNNIPAVKEGHVIELPASPYFNIGYSSIGRGLFVDEVTSLMESVQ